MPYQNREAARVRNRAYYATHQPEIRAQQLAHRTAHREEINAQRRHYYHVSGECDRLRARYATDPAYREARKAASARAKQKRKAQ